jgi:methylthioribose-1-phosphate isomerase
LPDPHEFANKDIQTSIHLDFILTQCDTTTQQGINDMQTLQTTSLRVADNQLFILDQQALPQEKRWLDASR